MQRIRYKNGRVRKGFRKDKLEKMGGRNKELVQEMKPKVAPGGASGGKTAPDSKSRGPNGVRTETRKPGGRAEKKGHNGDITQGARRVARHTWGKNKRDRIKIVTTL